MAQDREQIIEDAVVRLERAMATNATPVPDRRTDPSRKGLSSSSGSTPGYKEKTGVIYRQHVLFFMHWALAHDDITTLEQLDPRAEDLVTTYLQREIDQGKSPYVLHAQRAALRLFFDQRTLASALAIPYREMSRISRSRAPAGHDRSFQPDNWQSLIRFVQATGLHRQELRDLRAGDISQGQDKGVFVHVKGSTEGRGRDVPALPGHEEDVLAAKEGRSADARVFEKIPKHLDVFSYRREYAQALYLMYAPGGSLPLPRHRLTPADYDRAAVKRLADALGILRIHEVVQRYLR